MTIDDLPLQYNCVQTLEHNLAHRPDKIALYTAERNMTFRQVSQEVNQVGNALKKLGLRIGDFVAILSLDLPEWVTAFFGVIKLGGVAVGFNTTLTPKEYAYMLDDSKARIVVVHESLLPRIEEIRAGRPFLEHVIVIGDGVPGAGLISYADLIKGESTELNTALAEPLPQFGPLHAARVRFGVTPEVNALASLLLLVSIVTVIAAQRLTRLTGTPK